MIYKRIRLYGFTSQNTVIIIVTAVRPSELKNMECSQLAPESLVNTKRELRVTKDKIYEQIRSLCMKVSVIHWREES
jgi:hypothetical protein